MCISHAIIGLFATQLFVSFFAQLTLTGVSFHCRKVISDKLYFDLTMVAKHCDTQHDNDIKALNNT